jgi:hypothetical protein
LCQGVHKIFATLGFKYFCVHLLNGGV